MALLRNKRISTFFNFIRKRFPVVLSPALENSLSKSTEVAGIGHQKGKRYLVFSPPLQRIFLWAKFSCSRYVLTTILESTKSKMMSFILLSHLLLIFSPLHPFAFVLHLSLPLMLSLKYVTIFLQLRQSSASSSLFSVASCTISNAQFICNLYQFS